MVGIPATTVGSRKGNLHGGPSFHTTGNQNTKLSSGCRDWMRRLAITVLQKVVFTSGQTKAAKKLEENAAVEMYVYSAT